MIIDHPFADKFGQPPENVFVAMDEKRKPLGTAAVIPWNGYAFWPDRPHQFRLQITATGEARTMLLGAAIARALTMARAMPAGSSHIYAAVDVNERAYVRELRDQGLTQESFIYIAARDVTNAPNPAKIPPGCECVADALADQRERDYCLERVEAAFGEQRGWMWMDELCAQEEFRRLMLISANGIAAELLSYVKDGVGIIETVLTAPFWRRQHAAWHLIERARMRFSALDIPEMRALVPARLPGSRELSERAGFDIVGVDRICLGINT